MGASIAPAMNRRAFVTGLGAVLAAPLLAEAQQAGRVWRIGFLGPSPSGTAPHLAHAFRQGLSEAGYVEARNIVIEYRSTEPGDYERYRPLAAELVALGVDVLVTSITPAALAAKKATTTIPIVMVNVDDPVASGLVASLSRPGGNITGLSRMTPEIVGKGLALLKEAVPGAVKIAILSNSGNPFHRGMVRNGAEAASTLGIQLTIMDVKVAEGLEDAFGMMVRQRVHALLVLSDGMFFFNRTRIADLAFRNRLPSMFSTTELGESGWLMAYAASSIDNYRRAATYVDKILKGAKPADLPVEQPRKFELVINLRTAKALGLTIPSSLLLRADQVIE
jgi:putative tryptophan/tyrosine transport system substrate-binding protein